MNHVVWANNKITDIGSRIWNKKLISRDILYISDFINNDNSLMTYSQFRNKWNLDITDISSKAYVDIKMALRNFNCPSVAQRNITQINKEVCLYFFKDAMPEAISKTPLVEGLFEMRCTKPDPLTHCRR